MSPEKQREIASKGGRSLSLEARREIGRKGGRAKAEKMRRSFLALQQKENGLPQENGTRTAEVTSTPQIEEQQEQVLAAGVSGNSELLKVSEKAAAIPSAEKELEV